MGIFKSNIQGENIEEFSSSLLDLTNGFGAMTGIMGSATGLSAGIYQTKKGKADLKTLLQSVIVPLRLSITPNKF